MSEKFVMKDWWDMHRSFIGCQLCHKFIFFFTRVAYHQIFSKTILNFHFTFVLSFQSILISDLFTLSFHRCWIWSSSELDRGRSLLVVVFSTLLIIVCIIVTGIETVLLHKRIFYSHFSSFFFFFNLLLYLHKYFHNCSKTSVMIPRELLNIYLPRCFSHDRNVF